VLSIALRLTQNRSEAEDVVQEVFWCIHRRIATYDPSRPFAPWLYRITLNSAYTHLRRQAARRESSIEEIQPRMFSGSLTVPWERAVAPDIEERLAKQEMARRAEEIIAELPEEYGTVLWMHDVEDISAARVSKVLDLSLPAVKSRLYRGRLAVRELLLESLKMDRSSQTHAGQVPRQRRTRRPPVWWSQGRLARSRSRRSSRIPGARFGTAPPLVPKSSPRFIESKQ
jgi:RNA polymerase sigma-70 factor (ECF subfamily)